MILTKNLLVMKGTFTILFSIFLTTSLFSQTPVDVITGANYANEVYYNFDNDTLKTVPRNSWDIAFTAEQYSVSVLANNGSDVMLYTWSKGTIDDWETVDTTGMAWKPMYNSIVDWEEGAFNRNATGHPDYGWGIYNTSHNIIGDSIFIIQLVNGTFKKFAIEEKNAGQNTWKFKYADLDGTNDTTITLDAKNYASKSFIHFSIENNVVVDQEPDERWQLIFTRYIATVMSMAYPVSGVLHNSGVKVQQVNGVSQSDFEDYDLAMFADTISQIGFDWKTYSSSGYEVATDIVYFVQDTESEDQSIWKMYFTAFGGSSNGTYSFVKEKLVATGINETFDNKVAVYPNPAREELNVIHDFNGETEISVYNISGQLVLHKLANENAGLNKSTLNIRELPSGVYNVKISSGNKSQSVKFIKE